MNKKGLGVGGLKTLVVGVILMLILVSVYATYSANFTGITGILMGFISVGAAIGLFVKSLSG